MNGEFSLRQTFVTPQMNTVTYIIDKLVILIVVRYYVI